MIFETKDKDKNKTIKIDFFFEKSLNISNLNCRDRCKIILLAKGIVNITVCQNTCRVKAPAIILLNQEQEIKFSSDNIMASCFYFHPNVLNDLFEYDFIKTIDIDSLSLPSRRDFFLIQTFFSDELSKTNIFEITFDAYLSFKRLFECVERELFEQNDIYWSCRSRSYFIEMLFDIDRITRDYDKSKDLEYTVDDIIQYLSQNISEKVTLNDLTSRYLMNRNKINELFKEKMGMTFISFFNKLKIDMSSNLISHTKLTIKEIASRVGYDSIADFSNFFKKNIGMSPKKYREENKKLIKYN